MLGSRADTGGSIAEDVVVGGGTAAAPGAGVGVPSTIVRVVFALTRFGRGELGKEGGMCWLGVSLRYSCAVFDIALNIIQVQCNHGTHSITRRRRVSASGIFGSGPWRSGLEERCCLTPSSLPPFTCWLLIMLRGTRWCHCGETGFCS